MTTTTKRAAQLLSVTAAAQRLDCSRGHVYGLISAGALHAVNIGAATKSKTRIYESDLEQFIQTRTA